MQFSKCAVFSARVMLFALLAYFQLKAAQQFS
jgi:hypothetical protein